MVERAMAHFPKDSSLGESMGILKTNWLKTHTNPHTVCVRGRPTVKERFQTGWSANSCYYGLALRKHINLSPFTKALRGGVVVTRDQSC